MATMTVAQALASSATGITIADTPANIAAVVSNTALRARVTLFTLNASGASNASDARLIATLGSAFNPGSFRYTVRDTVAALTASKNAAGLSIASAISIFDTAANLLAAENSPLMQRASSVVLSTGTSLTLATLLRLEALPSFSVLPGQNLTLADSATNLLALTAGQNRAAIKAFQVTSNGTVTLAQGNTLKAMPGFSVAGGVTLAVSGTVDTMTSGTNATAIGALNAIAGVTINVSDTVAHVVSSVSALTGLASRASSTTVTITGSGSINATQANGLVPLVGRLSASNATITLADTADNLLGTAGNAAALARVTSLTTDADVTAAQLASLTAMNGFAVGGGVHLSVSDTLAALGALTEQQRAVATAVVVQDTLSHLLAAAGLPSSTTAVVVQVDGGTYTAAQAAQIAGLASDQVTLTLHPVGGATEMVVADTVQAILANVVQLTALATHGAVSVTPTDQGVTLSAASTAALIGLSVLDIGAARIAVSDTGEAITAARDALFGADLASITVTSGVFSGSVDQLLDPRLHLGTTPVVTTMRFAALAVASTPSAHLASDATVTAGQMIALSLLPGFSVDPSVTLTVADGQTALVSAASAIAAFATSVSVQDDAELTVAQATTLAELRSGVGAAHFTMDGHTLAVSDSAGHLAAVADPAWDALATTIQLDSDSVVTAAQAQILVAFGGRFATNGHSLVVIDTTAALSDLAADSAAVTMINGWNASVLLSEDAILSLAVADSLLQFGGFGPGSHRLTISDTAANLLAAVEGAPLALASAVQLSADATVTVANGATLIGLHNFATGGHALAVADTPIKLLGMSSALAALVSHESLVPRTVGNAADYTITAAQLAQLQGMTNLSASGFTGLITVADTADALAALAPSFASVTLGSLLSRVVVSLTGDATLGASAASALAQLPGFALGGHSLFVRDTPAALLSQGAATGIGMASSVGISGPATVNVATLTSLAALHAFAGDGYALVCADTPTALLGLAGSAAAFADRLELAAPAGNATAYTLGVSQFTSLAMTAKLSLTGFAGTVVVLDTPANLVALASGFAAASAGSPLLAARAVMAAQMSQDGSVSVTDLQALSGLPQFQLNGHGLVLQDTPTALLTAASGTVALAASITLPTSTQAWTVTATEAARLAALPNFTPGTTGFAVVDTAAAILSSGNQAGVALAASVTLSADATVDATSATALQGLGTFSVGTHHLTIQDGAGNIAALAPSAAALATSIVLQGDAIVSASQFTTLRGLANFSTAGHAVILLDDAANLLALSGSSLGLATTIILASNAALSAAQAETLATMPHFSAGTAQIAIVDTAAHLLQVTGAGAVPDDWAGELAATTVTLSQDATVTAAGAAELALLGSRFSRGGHALVVSDTAANLTADMNADGLALATAAMLAGDETALSAATATRLAALSGFAKGGHVVTVSDTVAALAFAGYAAGLALADHVQLSAPATVSVADATALVGLAAFQANANAPLQIADSLPHLLTLAGTTLSHNDALLRATAIGLSEDSSATAANLVSLAALPQAASFTRNGHALLLRDTGAHIATYTSAGSVVPTGYVMTGDATLTAAQATLLATRAVDLDGNAVTIADTVSALLDSANAAGEAIATALRLSGDAVASVTQAGLLFAMPAFHTGGYALTISGSAAGLIGLGTTAKQFATTLALAAAETVDVATLAGLTQFGFKFDRAGHTLTVQDTATNLVTLNSFETALVGSEVLGTSATVTAATAELLAALPAFALANGVTLTVQDDAQALIGLSAAARAIATSERLPAGSVTITAAQVAGLRALPHFVGSGTTIAVQSDTVAHVLAYANDVAAIGATIAVFDTAAHVQASLDALQALAPNLVSGITLSDGGTPVMTMTVATLAADSAVFATIVSPYTITVSDTAAHIQADLAGGTNAALVLQRARLGSVVVSDAGTVAITDTQALAAGVADSAGAVLAKLSGGSYTVSSATIARLDALTALTAAPASIAVVDTAAHIESDLISGVSRLLAHRAVLGSIAASGGGTITLTDAQVQAAHVDDGAGSIFSLLSGAGLVVSGVTVAHADTIAALPVAPQSFAVSDTAAAIQADLASGGGSRLLAHLSLISAIAISNAGTVSLTAAQALATGVDDGAGSAIAKLSGGSFVVTNTAVAQIATIASLPVAPSSIAVRDTAAHLQADLASGSSALLAHAGLVSGIVNADAGAITLTVAQVLAAGVDDGPTSLLTKLQGGSFSVSNAQLVDVATLLALTVPPTSISISDTAAHIGADLGSGHSVLLAQSAGISGITVNDAGTISLTVAQVTAAGVDDGAGSVLARTTGGTLRIIGATVADFAALDALTRQPASVAVVDTAAHIQADLASGTPVLLAHAGEIASIATIETLPTITLTVAQLAAAPTALALITTVFHLEVADTAAHVQADLASGGSVLIQEASALSGLTLSDGGTPTITLSVARLGASTGALALIGSAYHLDVADTVAAVASDLGSAVSILRTAASTLHAVTVSGGTTLTLSETQVMRTGVAAVLAVTSGLTNVLVTGVGVAQIPTVVALGISLLTLAISDSAAAVEADLTGGGSALEAHAAAIASIALTDTGTPTLHLDVAQLTAGSSVVARISTSYAIGISDTAAHVQSDLASGSPVLVAYASALSGITLTDAGIPTIALSMTQVSAAGTVLAAIGTSFHLTIADTAAHVQADLSSGNPALLSLLSDITAITLTDGGTPTITLSVAQVTAGSAALNLIGSTWTLAVVDTAAHVQSDLAAGSGSVLLAFGGVLGNVGLTVGTTITLTASEALHAGVSTVLAATTGLSSFVVTGATVAQVSTVLGLGIANTSMTVADTAAHVQSDLTGAGTLLTNVAALNAITLTDTVAPTITLSIAQVTADNAVLTRIGLPWNLAIFDTAAHLQADLAAGAGSALLAYGAMLSGVTLSSGHAITLTEAQATYGGVATVLAATTGLNGFVVTGVTVAQIPTVFGLGIANTSLAIADTAAHVQSDITGAGTLLSNAAAIGAITLTDGTTPTITLSIAQVAADSTVLALIGSSWNLAVSDTAAHVQADLAAGAGSTLLAQSSVLTSVSLTSGTTITLTEAQAIYAGVAAVLAATTGLGSLVVTGVTVAQASTVLGLGIPNTQLAMSDTAAHLQSDLTGGSPVLTGAGVAAALSGITLTDGGTPILTLSIAQATAASTALSRIGSPWQLAVSDTAAHVQTDLAAGASSTLLARIAELNGVTLTSSGSVTLTEAQATYAGVATVLAVTAGLTSFVVTGTAITQVGTVLGLGVANTSLTVADSAAHLQSDLNLGGSSVLLTHMGQITTIALTDGGTPTLSLNVAGLTSAAPVLAAIASSYGLALRDTAAHVQADLALGAGSEILARIGSLANITLSTGDTITLTESQAVYANVATALTSTAGLTTFNVTDVTVAQIGTVFGLGVSGTQVAVRDTAAHVQSDLTGGGVLLANWPDITGITLTDGGTPTLTLTVAQLASNASVLALIGGTFGLAISDTAAHVESDLTSGTSQLVAHAGGITDITLTDGGTPAITLTVAQIAASAAVLTRISSSHTITVNDTAAHVQSDLSAVSSGLVTVAASLGTITLTDGATPTITLAVAQIAAAGVVLGAIGSSYNLAAADTSAHVQADLALGAGSALLAHSGVLTGITLTSGSTITLTEAQAVHAGVSTALGLVTGMTTFLVTGVTIAQIATVAGLGVGGTRMTIADTAAHVESDITGAGDLVSNAGAITGITLTDGGTPTITLTVAQAAAANAALALIGSAWGLAIADTAAHVQSDLAAGAGSTILSHSANLASITLSGGTTITLTESQAVHAGVAAALIATSNLTSFVVTGATVAQFATVVALAVPHTSVAVSDTAANLQSDLGGAETLLANVTKLGSITLTDGGTPAITLNVAHLSANASVLTLIGSSYQVVVGDTGQNVQADLALGAGSTLVSHNGVLSQVNISSGDVTLTSAQVVVAGVDDGPSSVLSKLSGARLYVTNVAISDIVTILGLNLVPYAITVRDSAANVAADLAGAGVIASHAAKITAVQTTETTLDATTATTLYNGLHSVTTFDESALTVTDTAAALLTAQGAAPAMLTAAAHVIMSNNPTGLTAAQATTLATILGGALQNGQTMGVADTLANLVLLGNAAGIALATSVALSAPTTTTAALATQLVGLHAFTAGPALTIQDTVANLLNAAYTAGINAATTVSPSTDVTVSAATLSALSALHGYAAGSHVLTVQDTASAILGLTQPKLAFAGIVSVQDTVAHVTANVAALQAAIPGQGHTLSITLTDATVNVIAIDVTAANYATALATYAAISPAGVVRVAGNAAQLAAIASALQSNAAVGEVDVADTADNILSNLTALTGIGSKFMKATISDTVVNAAEVAALLTVPNLIATNLTISDTGTQIAAAILANGTPGLTFMNAHAVALSADSVIGASDAVLLEQLTNLSKGGYRLYIWDTAAHLTDSASGYLAAAQNALIDGVYLKATGHIATVSASLAATLLSISAFNRNDPPAPAGDGVANTLLVQDTAARIETYYATLSANRVALSGVVVSASATVNDSVFGHLLSLGATMDSGKALTVRDTAANIIANATTQMSGSPTITPVAWQISGSASVSTAGAILLGSLPGFTVGAYTLTLTDSATVTVAQANTLGTLGTSLQLGGHTLDVSGTVATMTSGPGLSANAKLIVTPHITDSFANLATLTLGSGLLGGTIVVSDSESVTVAQASSFLGLIGGSGIPAANVSFGSNVESITDTLAAIQTLTGGAAWTSTGSVHGSFHLVVADTVATLINASNTSALAAMNGTTIAANETITATAAESLFALSNGIHFNKGAHTLTIQDTAANLLNPTYSDGVALADVLQLSANGTVAAADAEALLTNSRFQLNHTLTVADSAASLLDGILATDIAASAYAASVVVQLAGPETLDAGTARAIVNLPGYQDTGNLTIADGASYLLNSANQSAEALATSVTLTGDETVSIATAVRLEALPHFTIGSNTLHLASHDFADAAALVTIGDLGAHWDSAGFNIRMTQDALALTPTEYAALQGDNIVLNGHALSALATGVAVSSASGTVQVTGSGVANATLNVYASSGAVLSQTAGVAASFTASASEASIGNGVVVTETVGASAATSESAPIIALERTVLTNAATSAGATFAGSGAVQVDVGKYVDIYTNSSAPAHPSSPVLVYDSSSYTLSLSIDGQAALTLVTLGTATHPTSLLASEIHIQHFV